MPKKRLPLILAVGGVLVLAVAGVLLMRSPPPEPEDEAVARPPAVPPEANVVAFLRLTDAATTQVATQALGLHEETAGRIALDVHVLAGGDAAAPSAADEVAARCALAQDAVLGLRFILCRTGTGRANDDGGACADELGLSRARLAKCKARAGDETRTNAAVARWTVTTTPRVIVNDTPLDGVPTRDALAAAVCAAASGRLASCSAPRAPGFPIAILTDARCRDCREDFWFRRMRTLFPEADVAIVDVQSPAGRTWMTDLDPGLLPAIALDARVAQAPAFAKVERELVAKNGAYLFSPASVRPMFDPARP